MKTIKNFITEASQKKCDTGNLAYVMPFKAFKKWLESVNKTDKFITATLVDTDMSLKDIERNQYSPTFYDNNEKAWVADGDSGVVPVNEWTLSDNDIILVFE